MTLSNRKILFALGIFLAMLAPFEKGYGVRDMFVEDEDPGIVSTKKITITEGKFLENTQTTYDGLRLMSVIMDVTRGPFIQYCTHFFGKEYENFAPVFLFFITHLADEYSLRMMRQSLKDINIDSPSYVQNHISKRLSLPLEFMCLIASHSTKKSSWGNWTLFFRAMPHFFTYINNSSTAQWFKKEKKGRLYKRAEEKTEELKDNKTKTNIRQLISMKDLRKSVGHLSLAQNFYTSIILGSRFALLGYQLYFPTDVSSKIMPSNILLVSYLGGYAGDQALEMGKKSLYKAAHMKTPKMLFFQKGRSLFMLELGLLSAYMLTGDERMLYGMMTSMGGEFSYTVLKKIPGYISNLGSWMWSKNVLPWKKIKQGTAYLKYHFYAKNKKFKKV